VNGKMQCTQAAFTTLALLQNNPKLCYCPLLLPESRMTVEREKKVGAKPAVGGGQFEVVMCEKRRPDAMDGTSGKPMQA